MSYQANILEKMFGKQLKQQGNKEVEEIKRYEEQQKGKKELQERKKQQQMKKKTFNNLFGFGDKNDDSVKNKQAVQSSQIKEQKKQDKRVTFNQLFGFKDSKFIPKKQESKKKTTLQQQRKKHTALFNNLFGFTNNLGNVKLKHVLVSGQAKQFRMRFKKDTSKQVVKLIVYNLKKYFENKMNRLNQQKQTHQGQIQLYEVDKIQSIEQINSLFDKQFLTQFQQIPYRNLIKICQSIQSSTIQSFQFKQKFSQVNKHSDDQRKNLSKLLYSISHINTFGNLKCIIFTQPSYINNIQCLTWLQSPNIEQITLQSQNITNLKPLSKLNFSKRLKKLSLMNNKFTYEQIKHIQRLNFATQIDYLKLILLFKEDQCYLQIFQSLFKLNFTHVKNFKNIARGFNCFDLKRKCHYSVLKKKYGKFQIQASVQISTDVYKYTRIS